MLKTVLQRKPLLLILALLISQLAFGAKYYSRVAIGDFATLTSWSTTEGGVTSPGSLATTDEFVILSGHNITYSASRTIKGIEIRAGGTLTSGATRVLTVSGGVAPGGIWLNNGTFVSSTGTVTFSGIVSIDAGTGTGSFNLVSIAASCTLTVNTPVTIGSNLSFVAANPTSKIAISGTNTLAVTGTVTMANITGGTRSSTLEVGDGTLTVGGTFTMSAASSSARTNNLTVNNGTINLQGITTASAFARITTTGTGTINISGLVTATGNPTLTAGSGTIKYNRSNTQTVFIGTYFNLTLGGTSAKSITTATTLVTGTFALEGTATYSAIPTYSGSAYGLRYSTSDARNTGGEWPATFSGSGGVTITSSTITVPAANPKTFPLDVPLTVSGGTLTTGANNFSLAGDFVNAGTWTSSTGAVTITGTRATQLIGKFTTTGLVSFTKASGTATLMGVALGGGFTMNGAGTLNLGLGFTHVFSGNWTNTAGTLVGNTSTLRIGGTSSGTGVTFTRNTSTVDFNGAGAQNIPAFIYHNLQTSTGNTKTLDGNTEVTGVLTINASNTFSLSNRILTLSGTGTPFVRTGTFTPSTGTVIYTNGTSNVTATTYTNLQTSGSQTLAGGVTVTGVLTINSGTLLAGANTITLSGTGTPFINSGTFDAGTGNVLYSNATATIAPLSYYNLQTQTVGTKTLGGNTTVTRVLTITSGTFSLSDKTLTLSYANTTPVVNSGTFTPSTGKVVYNGATQTVIALPYYDLQIETAGVKTLGGSITVTNILTLQSGSTFTMGAGQILTLSGTGAPFVNNSGNFNAGTSTVLYSNATATIAPLTYYNLQTQTAGTKTLGGNTTVTRVLTISSGNFDLSDKTLTISYANTAPIVNSGTFVASTGKVIFSGGTQTVLALPYYDLQIETAGIKLLGGTVTVSGTLTIQSGSTFAMQAAQVLTLSGTGTPFVNNSGTFTASTGTVTYTGATVVIAPLTYYNLQITNGTKTLGGNTTVGAVLTINTSTVLDLSDKILTLTGIGTPLVNSGGTFTAGTSTVVYSGATPTIAPLNYFNLTGSAGGDKIFPAGTIGVAGTFNPAGGTYAVDNANIVNFNGVGPSQTIPTFTFKEMIISGSGQKLIESSVGVKNVEIQTGPTLNINSTGGGTLTIN